MSCAFTFRAIKALIWKYMIYRKRNCFITLFENFLPLIVFIYIFLFRETLRKAVIYTPHRDILDESLSRILYIPNTRWTEELMSDVGKTFKLRQQNTPPNHNEFGYWAANESQINDFIQQIEDDEAVIIFQTLQDNDAKLNYTIKMNMNHDRKYYMYKFRSQEGNIYKYNRRLGEYYKKFLTLQWAIDNSYLKMINATSRYGQFLEMQQGLRKNNTHKAIPELPFILIGQAYPLLMSIVFIMAINKLQEDRISGMQMYIKMHGVTTGMILTSHFLTSFLMGVIHAIIASILLVITNNAIVQNTSVMYLMAFFLLYYCKIVIMGFAASYATKTKNYSTTAGFFIYIVTLIPYFIFDVAQRYIGSWNYFFCFLPHICLYYFLNRLWIFEMIEEDEYIQFERLVSIWYLYFVLITNIIFYSLLTWYLDKVRPGHFGFAQPINFLCQGKRLSQKKTLVPRHFTGMDKLRAIDSKYFEVPSHAEPGIRIVNVTKVYGSWTTSTRQSAALSNLTLDIYKGEITVLLGQNGAGKTTLMNIIRGMIRASEGTVFVDKLDIIQNCQKIQRRLGICLQKPMIFSNLTLREQVTFFALMNKSSLHEALKDADKVIVSMDLKTREHALNCHLSGGMLKRLQLACALVGDANIIILDEPTAGLDVESRRHIWNVLLSRRVNSTILMSTHRMEEAEAIANRVAVIHQGVLTAYGSPNFLKLVIGSGYRLSLTITKPLQEGAIDNIVLNETYGVFGSSKSDKTATTLNYILPLKKTYLFPSLFDKLESCRVELGIETIKVGVTKLDDVFNQLCREEQLPETITEDDDEKDKIFKLVTGYRLYFQIIIVLLKRQFIATWRDKLSFIFLQMIIPTIVICLVVWTSIKDDGYSIKPYSFLDLDKTDDRKVVLKKIFIWRTFIGKLYPDDDVTESQIESDRVSDAGSAAYENSLLEVHIANETAKLYYKNTLRSSPSEAINYLSNLLAQSAKSTNETSIITSNLLFISRGRYAQVLHNPLKENCVRVLIIMAVIQTFTTNEIQLVNKEMESGTRHLMIMSGCPAALFWAVTWFYDGVTAITFIILPTILAFKYLDPFEVLSRNDFLANMFFLSLTGVMAILLVIYVISLLFNKKCAFTILLINIVILGITFPALRVLNLQFKGSHILEAVIERILMTSPNSAYTTAALKITITACFNSYCHKNKMDCPNLKKYHPLFDVKFCCDQAPKSEWGPYVYFEYYAGGGKELLALIIHLMLLGTLVVWLQTDFFGDMKQKLMGICRKTESKIITRNKMVAQEAAYVAKHIQQPHPQDSMLVHNLQKVYLSHCYYTNIINGVSFSLKKGECFGLLGRSGAGKSTIFKMLNAEKSKFKGKIYCNGFYLDKKRIPYLKSLSYCPQFGGVDQFLSGADNLKQLFYIRGLCKSDVETQTENWIRYIGLEDLAEETSAGYSVGFQKRLSAATALSSNAQVLLMDEPTTGIDTAARRRVWSSMRRGLRQGRSILITSHGMDDMEALCHRLAILKNGEICAIGSPANLQSEYGFGYAIRLKILDMTRLPEGTAKTIYTVQYLKFDIEEVFDAELLDEHATLLHYRIMERMSYSELFRSIEELKVMYKDLIVDYEISETTLDEVFLSLSKN